jgi:hypothetical protein
MKLRPVGAEMFHVDRRMDGRTDMTKLIVAFRNFANAPKNDNCKYVRTINYCTYGKINNNLNVSTITLRGQAVIHRPVLIRILRSRPTANLGPYHGSGG